MTALTIYDDAAPFAFRETIAAFDDIVALLAGAGVVVSLMVPLST